MATTFQDIINELNNIGYDDWHKLNKVKPKSIELIKRSFPNDYTETVNQIQNLQFRARKGSEFFDTSGQNPIGVWNNSLYSFIGIMEAKKETFELRVDENKTLSEQNSSTVPLEEKINVLTEKLNRAESLFKTQRGKIDELETKNTRFKSINRFKTPLSNG